MPWELDDVLVRKFQKNVYVRLPDREARLVLLERNVGDLADMTGFTAVFQLVKPRFVIRVLSYLPRCCDAKHGTFDERLMSGASGPVDVHQHWAPSDQSEMSLAESQMRPADRAGRHSRPRLP
jgi:hypothetical protein